MAQKYTDFSDNELRKQALIGQMGGGVAPSGGGDFIPAQAIFDTSGMTGAQQAAFGRDSAAHRAEGQRQFDAYQQYAAEHKGDMTNAPAYTAIADLSPAAYGGKLVGGADSLASRIAKGEPTPGGMGEAQAAPSKTYALEGFDAQKLASGHDSPKYQIGRVLQKYDPKLGLGQAGLLDELNKLGIGQFSANSDKLSVSGGDPRFNGMNTWDSIRDQEGNAGWQFGVDSNLDTAAPKAGAPGKGGIPLNALLTGDPLASINSAIGQYGEQSSNLQALLRQLQGA